MNKVVDLTVDVLQRVGDTLGKHLTNENKHDYVYVDRADSRHMLPIAGSAFHRPLDRKSQKNKVYRPVRKYSSDNLAASPGYSSFSNYRQNPINNPYVDGVNRPPYGTGIGAPLNHSYSSLYSGGSSNSSLAMPYSAFQGNVGYAPEYYIAERRQVELVPAPPPRIIQQPVPYPVPVDRPVPQPYPVEVIREFPVDRPVPVPVPSPVPVDRPVLVPVPVPVPSPPPPPVCVPVPFPVAVPCYVPVGVPVPSPPPSPVMFEQSVTHTQRWVHNSPAPGLNPYLSYSNGSFIR